MARAYRTRHLPIGSHRPNRSRSYRRNEGNDAEKRARFEDLQQGSFYSIDPEGGGYFGGYFGDGGVKKDKRGDWWGSDYASGSDYSGGPVTVANYRALEKMGEEYEKESGIQCCLTMRSGHGGYHIFFNVYTTPDEIVETLAGLDDYEAISDEAVSEVEQEQVDEAWEGWAKRDFRRELEKKFGGDADEVSDEALWECLNEAAERANVYWEAQGGEGMWIDMKRVLAKVDEPPEGFVSE